MAASFLQNMIAPLESCARKPACCAFLVISRVSVTGDADASGAATRVGGVDCGLVASCVCAPAGMPKHKTLPVKSKKHNVQHRLGFSPPERRQPWHVPC